MKTILILCGLVLATLMGLGAWQLAGSRSHFGQPFAGNPPATLRVLTTEPAAYLGKPVHIRGTLKRQCPATGCWFFLVDPADPTARELKVEMGDTTPHLPARVGRSAQVEGQLIRFGDGYEFVGVAVQFE